MMEEKAKIAFDVRNRIRTQEMCMMAHQEESLLILKSLIKYLRNLLNPRWMDRKNKKRSPMIYITATKTNHTVNKKLEL